MATNFIAVNQMLSKKALLGLYNNLQFAKTVNRDLDSQWNDNTNGYRQGDSYKINRPARFKSVVGNSIGSFNTSTGMFETGAFVEDPIFLQVSSSDQLNISASFSSKELTLALSDEKTRLGEAVGKQLANDIEQKIVKESVIRGGMYTVAKGNSTLGTKIATQDLLYAEALLDSMTAPQGDRSALIPPFAMAQLSRENLNLFTPVQNADVYKKGYIKEFAGSEMYSYNLLPTYQVPAIANALTLTAAVTDGALKVTFSAVAPDIGKTLKAGTILEFSGYEFVNPATRLSTGVKYSFAITEDITLAASNEAKIDAANAIYGATDAGNRQNISGLPIIGDVVVVVGNPELGAAIVVTNTSSVTLTGTAFTQADVGKLVYGSNIPAGAKINSVVTGVSATMSVASTGTCSSVRLQAPSALYEQVVMYHQDAYTATIIPLTTDLPGAYAARADYDGFSIRASMQTVIGSDTVVNRFDVFGKGIIQRDQYACRVLVPK